MSHVATVELEVKDLDALERACKRLGLELRRGQETYRWFGEHVGDFPLPEGFTEEDLGKCTHAIAISGTSLGKEPIPGRVNISEPYEIGVVRRRDGKPGFTLMWDFWQRGHGLQDKVGENCNALHQAYSIEVAKKHAQLKGYQVQESKQDNGAIKLILRK